jgi:hypothetical protein
MVFESLGDRVLSFTNAPPGKLCSLQRTTMRNDDFLKRLGCHGGRIRVKRVRIARRHHKDNLFDEPKLHNFCKRDRNMLRHLRVHKGKMRTGIPKKSRRQTKHFRDF